MLVTLMFGVHVNQAGVGWHLLDRISARDSPFKCKENISLLKHIVMSEEKWILYNNMEWKSSWGY